MDKLPFLICLLLLASCAGSNKSPKQELVNKYKIQIGCTNYALLRLAPGNHEDLVQKINEDQIRSESHDENPTAIVYRGLNKHILFIHLVYRNLNNPNPRKIVNYLFDKSENEIVGYYQCN